MKQNINVEQIKELSQKGKERLSDWMVEKGDWHTTTDGEITLPSIGQMIEFIHDSKLKIEIYDHTYFEQSGSMWRVAHDQDQATIKDRVNLCDALWEAVKEVLNK